MIHLKDYKAPEFHIRETRLSFEIFEGHCLVHSELLMEKVGPTSDLFLDGEELELLSVKIDGKDWPKQNYTVTDKSLTLHQVPDKFKLAISVKIHPEANTSLAGLYCSRGIFITQCEAQSFRRITYFLDRPDVMSMYTVSLEADKKYPVLLSNGDLVEHKDLANNRHRAIWKDPFKKPSYLFALVAGNLGVLEDTFTTRSGKKVALKIYAEHPQISKCHYAMDSLKQAMKWDEERFGLEYDLSNYMIVATDDFNAGAMENKGLNVFNSRLILADPGSATDSNYEAIESVIAHEYFHNWTGNRVTLRDWFHLSLKEGLTVFRDQEFSMDQISRDLIRIENVIDLRDSQFPEDQGPNAHPIRPESCYSVDNFFTTTIYEKGSEVIRMMQTLVGRPGFRKGMDLYFKRHDGQAVIIEDFARAIAEANDQKWDQFQLWYSQAGTPRVKVNEKFENGTYTVSLAQSCPPTPGQDVKKPFHIPLSLELFDRQGKTLPVQDPQVVINSEGRKIFHLRQSEQVLKMTGLKEKPVLSLNREFSAPIELEWSRPDEDLYFLFTHDNDCFNRWEAGQTLMLQELKALIANPGKAPQPKLAEALQKILQDEAIDPALRAQMIDPPSIAYLAQFLPQFDPKTCENALHSFYRAYGEKLLKPALAFYQKAQGQMQDRIDPKARALRSLKNICLKYLCWAGQGLPLAVEQFEKSPLMTDQERALILLAQLSEKEGQKALLQFYERWKDEPLVLNKWWNIQASLRKADTFQRVQELGRHPAFRIKNPNCVYSLYGVFGDNLTQFHRNQGECYSFFANKILEVDRINPQVAARISSAFDFCPRLDTASQAKAREAIKMILDQKLSENTFEILSKTMKALTQPSPQGSTVHATEVS